VKVFAEERELTALIAVDRSASHARAGAAVEGGGGGGDRRPARLLRAGERRPGRALLFTDRIERVRPAAAGKKHGLR